MNLQVAVAAPPRGGGTQAAGTLAVQSLLGTFAWGSAPGLATIVYVGAAAVTVGALVTIRFGRHFFTGICKSDTEDKGVGGQLRTLEFQDVRFFLEWDFVYGAFNLRDVRIVNGVRKKQYRHLYPANFDTWNWTYTDAPLTANEIVAALLGAPTVGTAWTFSNNGLGEFGGSLLTAPVFELDATSGLRLDAALNQVAQATGTVFGVSSTAGLPYRLVFTRKGYGVLPTAALRDSVRTGVTFSGHPTRLRILGGRNAYQANDLVMDADWATAWEAFIGEAAFVQDIFERATDSNTGVRFNAIAGDTKFYRGYALAAAYARVITVREYVALRNAAVANSGNAYADQRKYSGRSRMDMPALEYLRTLVFRAFRPNATSLATAGLTGATLVGRQLCRVTHNLTTGAMTAFPTEPVDGNGYAVVKGFQAGDFSQIRSDQFDLDQFAATKAVWGVQGFQVDDSGEDGTGFIIFGVPVFTSNNLLVDVNGHKMLNAAFTLQVPQVRAALTFERERFSWWQQNAANSRDAVENVSGLNAELVGSGGVYSEIVYADGKTAGQWAATIATNLLQRQFYYVEGSHRNIWDGVSDPSTFGTPLSAMVDRIRFEISATGGIVETVDYTNERGRDNFEPERELERRTLQNSLTPRQAELSQEAEVLRATARALKNPQIYRSLNDALNAVGNEHPLRVTWCAPRGSGTLSAGTVLREASNSVCIPPANATSANVVFAGVVVHHNANPAKQFLVASTGIQPVLVQGPVSPNDTVGLSSSPTAAFLVKDGTPSVGKVLETIADGSTRLVKVMLGSGGGGPSAPATVARYRIKSFLSNYMICRTWDGSADGGVDVLVAKPTKLRNDVFDTTVDGADVHYSYDASTLIRTATAPLFGAAVHVIVPRYKVNDIIHVVDGATGVTGPGSVAVTKLDLNVDGRAWARIVT